MLLGLLFVLNANAGSFNMNYRFKSIDLTVIQEAKDYNEAIELSSDKCLKFYFKMFKVLSLTEEEKVGLANVCTNPR